MSGLAPPLAVDSQQFSPACMLLRQAHMSALALLWAVFPEHFTRVCMLLRQAHTAALRYPGQCILSSATIHSRSPGRHPQAGRQEGGCGQFSDAWHLLASMRLGHTAQRTRWEWPHWHNGVKQFDRDQQPLAWLSRVLLSLLTCALTICKARCFAASPPVQYILRLESLLQLLCNASI